jgi:phosphatidylserine/phosphatidylglycerophosphate/cardiolipin synthase-like enzyme
MRLFFTLLVILALFYAPSAWAAYSKLSAEFSPSPKTTAKIVHEISLGKHEIRVAAYSYTSVGISVALIEAKNRGVTVNVVIDKGQVTHPSKALCLLASSGTAIKADYKYAIMHNKYMVIDKKTVQTGSFNYTTSAEKRNAENVVVIRDKKIAKKYGENWEKLWDESRPISFDANICPNRN